MLAPRLEPVLSTKFLAAQSPTVNSSTFLGEQLEAPCSVTSVDSVISGLNLKKGVWGN
jgi:hypothetical protein